MSRHRNQRHVTTQAKADSHERGVAQLRAYFGLTSLPPRTDLSKAHHARERPSQGGILSRMRRGEL